MFCNKMLRLQELYRYARILAVITVVYNLFEGVVSICFGAEDETLSLFGFGVDSFVEVVSGIGILHMLLRLARGESQDRDAFEKTALRITGGAFYVLAAGMIATAVASVVEKHHPVTTVWGIVVSAVSIVSMLVLTRLKVKVGTELNSSAILADAACTRTCLQLSVALLAASIAYELTGIGYLDAIGSSVIGILSIREGREALQKAKGMACSCSCSGTCGS